MGLERLFDMVTKGVRPHTLKTLIFNGYRLSHDEEVMVKAKIKRVERRLTGMSIWHFVEVEDMMRVSGLSRRSSYDQLAALRRLGDWVF